MRRRVWIQAPRVCRHCIRRTSRDPAGVYGILIAFADRSRRLPDLCENLAGLEPSTREVARVIRVAKAASGRLVPSSANRSCIGRTAIDTWLVKQEKDIGKQARSRGRPRDGQ
jgi:hypothetical protein